MSREAFEAWAGREYRNVDEYTARRLELARQRDEWADAIAFASKKLAANACGEPGLMD